jgi:hypothetical protein
MGTEDESGLLFPKEVDQRTGIEAIKGQSPLLKMPRPIKRLVDKAEQIGLPGH